MSPRPGELEGRCAQALRRHVEIKRPVARSEQPSVIAAMTRHCFSNDNTFMGLSQCAHEPATLCATNGHMRRKLRGVVAPRGNGGLPRGAGIAATALIAVVTIAARFAGAPGENVNLAFTSASALAAWIPSHALSMTLTGVFVSAECLLAEALLGRYNRPA